MGFLVESTVGEIVVVTGITILWTVYRYVTKHYNYWRERGVPYIDAMFPFGSLWGIMLGQKNVGEGFEECYKQLKDKRFFGVFNGRSPTLVVNDLDLIKQILVKDFSSFFDRNPLSKFQDKEYIVHHLFNMSGQDWRNMRLTLAPTYTSGKMKMMFVLLEKCSDQLQKYMETQINTKDGVDVKKVLAKFTINAIGSCAFGLDVNCFSDKNCEFYSYGIQVFKTTTARMIRRIWYSVFPVFAILYAPPMVKEDITKFFTRIISDTISYREKNKVNRNDFLDLLINIRKNKNYLNDEDKSNGIEIHVDLEKKKSYKQPELTLEEITAQSFVFFAAGFEASSSTTSFCLYLLACNPDIQDKLFTEIKEVLLKHEGKATYQALQEMSYMDQVINETLRLYSSLSILNRTCTKTYRIPDSDLVLEKGTKIVIPISAIHHDPKYFPEPYKFDPERFSLENRKLRHPFAHLPFGEGPRMCIGMRFGLMQTKVALTTMLHNYHFDKTPEIEIPVKIDKKAFITLPEKPLLLRVTKRAV